MSPTGPAGAPSALSGATLVERVLALFEGALSVLRTTRTNLALQDYAMLAMHGLLAAQVALRGRASAHSEQQTAALLGVTLFTLLLTRGGLLPAGSMRSLVYRFGMFGTMVGSYFELRTLLPSLNPVLLDVPLSHLDERLFGQTPAVWLDAYVTPGTVEWFAFFYYSYFWLLGVYLVGALLFDGGRRRYELLLSAGLVVAIGHVTYTLVPGAGPYAAPHLHFQHALQGGIWWQRVETTVRTAGALLDIFPSLHTALSVLVGLHAYRYRREAPIRFMWLPTWFFVGNIVIATVFLRWHYGIDLIAGTALAVFAQQTAIRSWHREGSRELHGPKQAVWEPALPSGLLQMEPHDRRWFVGVALLHAGAIALVLGAAALRFGLR